MNPFILKSSSASGRHWDLRRAAGIKEMNFIPPWMRLTVNLDEMTAI